VWGGVPSLIGLGVGVTSVIVFQRVLASLLYGVTATDPITLAVVAVVLFAMAGLAMLVPARRATRVDPLLALRSE
jgi:putative ABC transport system permease protein